MSDLAEAIERVDRAREARDAARSRVRAAPLKAKERDDARAELLAAEREYKNAVIAYQEALESDPGG